MPEKSRSTRISGYVQPKLEVEFEELKAEAAVRDGDPYPRPNGIYLARLIKYRVSLDRESVREFGKMSERRREQARSAEG